MGVQVPTICIDNTDGLHGVEVCLHKAEIQHTGDTKSGTPVYTVELMIDQANCQHAASNNGHSTASSSSEGKLL